MKLMRSIAVFLILILPFFGNSQKFNFDKLSKSVKELEDILASPVGISIYDIENNKEIFSKNSEKNFIPASVLKLLYTFSLIDNKGKNTKFLTKFYSSGDILHDGTLTGNLLIYSSGDPSLGSPRYYKKGIETVLEMILKNLKSYGISCIDGDIILVLPNRSFPVNGNWLNEDISNYYGGGTWGFNINDNEYSIEFDLGKNVGDNTKVLNITPKIPELKIHNFVTKGKKGSGDNAYIYGDVLSYERYIRGTLSDNKTKIKGAIPKPPTTFLNILSRYLYKNGIYHDDLRIYQNYDENKNLLFSIKSPDLLTLAKECNDYSINLYSEAFAKLLCLKENHPNDYLYNEELESFFKKYISNIKNIHIDDGCGLSPKNLISPITINKFINSMINRLGLEIVLDVLPQVGRDGHYKNMLNKNQNYWIKSGSMENVRNYSGIYKDHKNKYYIFSIMTNNSLNNRRKLIKKSILNIMMQFTT